MGDRSRLSTGEVVVVWTGLALSWRRPFLAVPLPFPGRRMHPLIHLKNILIGVASGFPNDRSRLSPGDAAAPLGQTARLTRLPAARS